MGYLFTISTGEFSGFLNHQPYGPEAMPKWHLRGNTAMSQVRRGVDSIFGRHRLGIPITFFVVGNLLNSSEYGGLKEASTQEFVENKPEDMRIL